MRIKSHKIITDPIDREFLRTCIFAYLDKIYLHDDQINYKNCIHTHTHTQSDEYDLHPVEFLEKKKHYANWKTHGTRKLVVPGMTSFSIPLPLSFNNFKRVIVASATDKRKSPPDVNFVSVHDFRCIITDDRFEDS